MRKFLVIVLALVVSFSMTVISFASSNTSEILDTSESINTCTVIDALPYENHPEVLGEKISEALESSDHIKIVNLTSDEMEAGITLNDVENTQARPLLSAEPKSGQGTIYYKITGVKSLSHTYGSDYLNVAGAPGVTIGLSRAETESYSITFGATFSCPKNIIATASWGTTKAVTLTYSGTWKVPTKHNGKKVKRGRLHMRPEYSRKQYTVYSKVNGYTDWKKKGTSTTKRAYGADIYKTFTYK
ncbi:MAG: hypothetical protein VB031_06470 [Eubacteriaceae bacterium]|nr:hypothetical protein [Eubacteriaceae bacterium]